MLKKNEYSDEIKEFCSSFTYLISELDIFPEVLKTAKVIPLHKKND